MKSITSIKIASALLIVASAASIVSTGAPANAASSPTASCPWTDPSVVASHTPTQLADMIVAKMSVSEQVALTGLHNQVNGPAENIYAGDPSLCVPSFVLQDGPMGIVIGGSPQIPSDIALGATFDTAEAQAYGNIMGQTAVTDGISVIQGPDLNTTQMPTWGRRSESLGESPYLAGIMGAGITQGIQSTGTQVVMKHVGVYVREFDRMNSNQIISTRGLEESYLAPFRSVTALNPFGEMCAYGQLNGVNQCLSTQAISSLKAMGFTGTVRSDLGGVGGVVPQAIAAGVNFIKFADPVAIQTAINDGTLSRTALSNAVRQVLIVMFDHNMFNNVRTFTSHANTYTSASTAMSTSVSEESSVLLKNSGSLPLPAGANVSVISANLNGSTIYTATGTTGDIYSASGSFGVNTNTTSQTSPFQGLSTALGASNVSQTIATPSATPVELMTPTAIASGTVANKVHTVSIPYYVPQNATVDFTLSVPFHHPYGTGNMTIDGHSFLRYTAVQDGAISNEYATYLTAGTHMITVTYTFAGPAIDPSLTATNVTDAIAQAVAAAKTATYAVVNVTTGNNEGEAQDLPSLQLPGYQDQLIQAVANVNPHTIVVINSGGAVLMPWLNSVSAVVEQWFAGSVDGTALAALLTGAVNFSGHLPVTFPASNSGVPFSDFSSPSVNINMNGPGGQGLNTGYLWYRATNTPVLFPFGYGLSYTNFNLSDPTITQAGQNWAVSVKATNMGAVAGRVVVQGYLTDPSAANEPSGELKVVGSANVGVGQTVTVNMLLTKMAIQTYQGKGWQTVGGQYHLALGQSSDNTPLGLNFNVNGINSVPTTPTTTTTTPVTTTTTKPATKPKPVKTTKPKPVKTTKPKPVTTTTKPVTTVTTPNAPTTTDFNPGMSTPGAATWVAAKWVMSYYSSYYKWANILYGPNVMAVPYETPQFAASNTANDGSLNSPVLKNQWNTIVSRQSGVSPFISSVLVPQSLGVCTTTCVVQVTWKNGTRDSAGDRVNPANGVASNTIAVTLTFVNDKWLVSSNPGVVVG